MYHTTFYKIIIYEHELFLFLWILGIYFCKLLNEHKRTTPLPTNKACYLQKKKREYLKCTIWFKKKKKRFTVILFLCFFLKNTEIWRETENIVNSLAFSLPTKWAEEQIVTAIAVSSQHDVVSLWGKFWLPYSSKMCHLFYWNLSVLKWWWFVSVVIFLPLTQIPWICAWIPLCELSVGWRFLLWEWATLQHSSGEASILFS